MTMKLNKKIIPAGEFKAKCLAILDEVQESGQAVTVTKRGKPVAKIVPAIPENPISLRGSVTFHSDIVGPILDEWEAEK
jgi:prevent-host-death family protein